jgi:hypothetical protein
MIHPIRSSIRDEQTGTQPFLALRDAVSSGIAMEVPQRIICLPPLVLAARSIESEKTAPSLIGSPLRPVSSRRVLAGAGRH